MKKHAKRRITRVLQLWPFIASFIAGVLCGVYSLQAILTFTKWDESTVASYQGEYAFREKTYYRNTNYLFTLGNGDIVEIPCEYMNDNFTSHNSALLFKYVKFKDIFLIGRHRPISVSSIDGKAVFFDETIGRRELYLQTITFAPLSMGLFFFSGIPIYFRILQSSLFRRILQSSLFRRILQSSLFREKHTRRKRPANSTKDEVNG